MALFGLFGKEKKEDLDKGLERPAKGFFPNLEAVAGKATVDAEFLDELEEILISSDVGLDTTVKIIGRLEERVARDKYLNTAELQHILREEIVRLLRQQHAWDYDDFQLPLPPILYHIGGRRNGVGKTTTIGKLASQFKSQGKKYCWVLPIPSGLPPSSISSVSGLTAPAWRSFAIRWVPILLP